MTKSEFMAGWRLLVLQPWGRLYNKVGDTGYPTGDAVAQFDLYYDGLKWGHPCAWEKVARQYGGGSKWPSLEDLITSLRAVNQAFVQALVDDRTAEFCECPPEVRVLLEKLQGKPAFSFTADTDRATA